MNFIHRFLKSLFLFDESTIDVSWILTCEFIRMKTRNSVQLHLSLIILTNNHNMRKTNFWTEHYKRERKDWVDE